MEAAGGCAEWVGVVPPASPGMGANLLLLLLLLSLPPLFLFLRPLHLLFPLLLLSPPPHLLLLFLILLLLLALHPRRLKLVDTLLPLLLVMLVAARGSSCSNLKDKPKTRSLAPPLPVPHPAYTKLHFRKPRPYRCPCCPPICCPHPRRQQCHKQRRPLPAYATYTRHRFLPADHSDDAPR